MAIYYPPTKDFTSGTLGAELLSATTASATLNTTASALGLQNALGVMIIDRVDANGVANPTKAETISYAGTSGSTVTTLVRALAGTTQQTHAVGAIIEFGPDIIWAQGLIDFFVTEHTTAGVHTNALVTSLKASGANINTGTSDVLIVTPKAIVDSAIPSATSTTTFTNKRITKRVTTDTSSATPTPNSDTSDVYTVTALAEAATFGAPSGTPTNGQTLVIRIEDNGTARALNFNAAYRFGDVAKPTTTVLGKVMYLGFMWNSTDSKWDCLAYIDNL